MLDFFSVNTQKDVVGITRHVVTTISAFSFSMLLLDRILTHIVNHLSNTSYQFQYLYYPGGNETGAKPNLITCITEIFLSVSICYWRVSVTLNLFMVENMELFMDKFLRRVWLYTVCMYTYCKYIVYNFSLVHKQLFCTFVQYIQRTRFVYCSL